MSGVSTPPTYPSGPAALFHANAASGTKKKKNTLIWAYCPSCWTQTDQQFVEDDGKFERYICLECQVIHSIAVR